MRRRKEAAKKLLDEANLEYASLVDEYKSLESEAALVEKTATVEGDNLFNLFYPCLQLAALMQQRNIDFYGPLGIEIEFSEPELAPLFGQSLFEFVIAKPTALATITDLIAKNWSENPPAFTISVLHAFEKPKRQADAFKRYKNRLLPLKQFLSSQNSLLLDFIDWRINALIYAGEEKLKISELMQIAAQTKRAVFSLKDCVLVQPSSAVSFLNRGYIGLYKKMNEQRKHSLDEIENAIEAFKKRKSLQKRIENAEDEVEQLRTKWLDLAEEFKEREDAVETYNQLEQDCAKTKERIEEIRLEIEQKESELIEIEKKIQQFKFAEDLTDALDKLQNEKTEINGVLGRFQQQESSLKNSLDDYKTQLKKIKKLANEAKAAAQTYVAELPEHLKASQKRDLEREKDRVEDELKRLEKLNISLEQFLRKEEELRVEAGKLNRSKKIFAETQQRLIDEKTLWQAEIERQLSAINQHMQSTLAVRFADVRAYLSDTSDFKKTGLHIEVRHKNSREPRHIRILSGGERGLVTEAFLFATHLLTYSPLHIIDEFTQRMDKASMELIFNIASITAQKAAQSRRESFFEPHFIVATPSTDALEFSDNSLFQHLVCFKLYDNTSIMRVAEKVE